MADMQGPLLLVCNIVCSALVWGSSVKHQPQKVGKDHILNDEDVIQIVKKYVYHVCPYWMSVLSVEIQLTTINY